MVQLIFNPPPFFCFFFVYAFSLRYVPFPGSRHDRKWRTRRRFQTRPSLHPYIGNIARKNGSRDLPRWLLFIPSWSTIAQYQNVYRVSPLTILWPHFSRRRHEYWWNGWKMARGSESWILCSPSMVFILREGYRCIGLTHFHLTRGWIEEHDGRCDDRRGSKKGKDGWRGILMDYSRMGSPHTRGGKVCKGFETSGSRWNEQRFWDRQSVLGKKTHFSRRCMNIQ